MATFKFNPKVDLDRADITDAAIGAAAAAGWGTNDIGKLVKLKAGSTDHNYVAVADGNAIEGFIISVEPFTVNSGFAFGSVQRNGRVVVKNVSAGTTLAVGDYVAAATQATAIGTAGKSQVKVVTGATLEALNFKWRVISLMAGTGLADQEVLIERV